MAKLDIAVDSDSKGRGFESLRADQVKSYILRDQNVAFSYIFKQKTALHAILLAWRDFYDNKNDSFLSQARKIAGLRVAAYCRVSTNYPEQFGSLETQKSYFETIIRENPNWQFVKIYSDVGSALRIQNRPGYRQMILDGKKGLFDFVLVKSLSRFGRDTVETLTQIRKWKQMNIGLYAEMEDIDTMKVNDSALSIFLAMAQEESCNKSENIKFGIRARMRSGKTILNHSQFLGYTKGTDGVLVIVPEEAEMVRKIFDLYLQGNGVRKMKRYLEEQGIKAAMGKETWSSSTIDRMLSNVKYIGQVLMQKTYTPDFLTGKQAKNDGALSMFLVENAHEAIIDKETFMNAQERKKAHQNNRTNHSKML